MSTTQTSKKKAAAILEAIMLWNECRNLPPDTKNETIDGRVIQTLGAYAAYFDKLNKAGWNISNMGYDGSFKACFYKNNIAVKFPKYTTVHCGNEIRREYEQWLGAPPAFKKYLIKTYCMLDLVLIQDKVIAKCDRKSKCSMAEAITKYPLTDYAHNHGHSQRGQIKFFDWVYNRTMDHLNNPDMRLYA